MTDPEADVDEDNPAHADAPDRPEFDIDADDDSR